LTEITFVGGLAVEGASAPASDLDVYQASPMLTIRAMKRSRGMNLVLQIEIRQPRAVQQHDLPLGLA
jgi:hypothetical protein